MFDAEVGRAGPDDTHAVAVAGENQTEAFLKDIGDSYQEHYARNLAEAKAVRDSRAVREAKAAWLQKSEAAQAAFTIKTFLAVK